MLVAVDEILTLANEIAIFLNSMFHHVVLGVAHVVDAVGGCIWFYCW